MVLWSKDKRRHTSYFRFFNKFGLILLSALEKKNSLCSHLGVESPPRALQTLCTLFLFRIVRSGGGAPGRKRKYGQLLCCVMGRTEETTRDPSPHPLFFFLLLLLPLVSPLYQSVIAPFYPKKRDFVTHHHPTRFRLSYFLRGCI